MNIVEWLIEDGNVLVAAQVLAALITAAATIALWRVTRVLARETTVLAKETTFLAEITSRPFVLCGIESSPFSKGAMNVTLRNTGNAAAFDIKVNLTPALPEPDEALVEFSPNTSFEISFLPPSQSLELAPILSRKIVDTEFAVDVSWAHSPGAEKRDNLVYALSAQDGYQAGWNEKKVHQLTEEIEKLREVIAAK